jgi:DNA-binding GntR family transcriptional regulator
MQVGNATADGSSLSRESLADKVFTWLTAELVSGALRPGQWVSENEIARTLGVSRTPVREALIGLSHDSLVEMRPGRGTIIADIDPDEADDLFRTRVLIEAEVARLAIAHADDETARQLEAIAGELRAGTGQARVFFEGTRRTMNVLQASCPNRVLCQVSATLWRRSLPYRRFVLGHPAMQEAVVRCTEQLAGFARTRDGDGAARVSAELYESVRQTVLESAFVHP